MIVNVDRVTTLAMIFLRLASNWREGKGLAERLTPRRDTTTTETRIPTFTIDPNERTVLGLVPTTLTLVLTVIRAEAFGITAT